MQAGLIIDQFVARINSGYRERLFESECPPSVRVDEIDKYGQYDWQIISHDFEPIVFDLETRTGLEFDPAFRSFISRYAYPQFDHRGISLFANLPENGGMDQFRTRLFGDPVMSELLLTNGFLQIGHPDSGSYDPVCIAPNGGQKKRSSPVVVLDHESALMRRKIIIKQSLFSSFADFAESRGQPTGDAI